MNMSPLLALAAAQISDGVVKIGVLTDLSGVYSDNTGTGSVTATRMAVEDFGGKVLGMPIEVVAADHQGKADVSATLARKWIDEEKVDAVTNFSNSSVAIAVQNITREKNRIQISTAAASSDMTGKHCSPTGFQWIYDTYSLAAGIANGLVRQGGDTWFFVTVDYAFGHSLERDTARFVTEAGGKVLGTVRHPLGSNDLSSFLLQEQHSGAKVIGLANAGGDFINTVKQAAEFGIVARGQRLAGLLLTINEIRALGLKTAQGLVTTDFGYWDQDDDMRAWNKRFMARHGRPANYIQAGDYSATLHYLKAIQAAGTDEAKAVAAQMKAIPVNDFMSKNVKVREDGRALRPAHVMQVKAPSESQGEWDFYKLIATVPPEQAVRPLAEGECPFLAKK